MPQRAQAVHLKVETADSKLIDLQPPKDIQSAAIRFATVSVSAAGVDTQDV